MWRNRDSGLDRGLKVYIIRNFFLTKNIKIQEDYRQPFSDILSTTFNAGQNNLAKTSDCVFLSRKGDISELPLPQFQCCS